MTPRKPIAPVTPESKVRIRRQYNDWKIGTVPLAVVRDPQFSRISGGGGHRSPRPMLYVKVYCDQVEGAIGHNCEHGPPPHDIRVCVTKKDNEKRVYDYLAGQVQPLVK
jgi:hypothetical protein